MAWLIGIVLVFLFLVLLFRFPAQTIGLVALLVVGIWLLIDHNNQEYAASEKAQRAVDAAANAASQAAYARSLSLVMPSQIALSGMLLNPQSAYGSASSYSVTGNIQNNSNFTLTGLTLTIRLENCPGGTSCVIVGQNAIRAALVIPAGQARGLNEALDFPNLPAPIGREWNYRVVSRSVV